MTRVQLSVGQETAGMSWKELMGAIIQVYTAELYKNTFQKT